MKIIRIIIAGLIISLLSACSQTDDSNNTVRVAVIAGDGTQLMHTLVQIAKEQYGIDIKLINVPNNRNTDAALVNGSIDANILQSEAFLRNTERKHHYPIVAIGESFMFPMAIYSQRLQRLADIKRGAWVAIPNDPSNESRALELLQQAGLIQLRKTFTPETLRDISANPKRLHFRLAKKSSLPNMLNIYPLAVFTSIDPPSMGCLDKIRPLLWEKPQKDNEDVVVVRQADQNKAKFINLVNAIHSKQVMASAKQYYPHQDVMIL